ncbi:MAG: bifunctional acetate--CoA ligase family protein/GNAT family N-acetyltransferase [Alphaproteobacteria bacterium]|nr:bifunctional acetate--CoA ligase family protein/GNAT family N-acetyltransferase [Alphaproteobacteria bacterium]MCW5743441.1 bifunctional acetate--CoA ligase family protein/GNAT family N-acetyltransferase [Alphaproteobacteria bacterium]
MTIRNFEALFSPKSVALIGASSRPSAVGALIARNLHAGGFNGPLWLVNRNGQPSDGHPTLKNIKALPSAPDLAILCVPAAQVAPSIAALAARGTRAAVVITAGLDETTRGAALEIARPTTMRIVGPNCLGIMVPALGLNATFAHRSALKGGLGFVSQSGAVITAAIDWASARNIGFSHVVSLGEMCDVDFGDMLDWLALDGATSAILLHVESITSARKFMSAARAAARSKPVIVLKAGRSEAAARAAHAHVGALAGADAVYDAAFRRAGMLRVEDLDGLFEATASLASSRPLFGDRLAILTNGGGLGVLAADALIETKGRLAELAPETLAKLEVRLPPTWSRGNPVDILGDAPAEHYEHALDALLDDPGVDAALVLNCPTAVTPGEDSARAVATAASRTRKPVLTSWVGADAQVEARKVLLAANLPTYETPRQAVRGFMDLVTWRRNRVALMETPPSQPEEFALDIEAARAVIAAARAQGRDALSEAEAKEVLDACAIPVVDTIVARSPEEAVGAAMRIGAPVALKILSPDIVSKSEVGGVVLDLHDEGQVFRAASDMLARVARLRPGARIEGFSVQRMVERRGAWELIVGLAEDRTFGPVVLFGHGGTAVERLADHALGLPPLNMKLARDMIEGTRVWRLLQGYGQQPAAAIDAIALSLIKVAQIAAELPAIAELEINPLLVDAHGVVALDARIRLRTEDAPARALAIRPYPRGLERRETLRGERAFLLRPIRPEDEGALQTFGRRLDREDIRMRFFAPLAHLTHELAARLTQIDYDRQMAFVALGGEGEIWGVVRLSADPDNVGAEFAIIVRSDLKGSGLGRLLMARIIGYARQRGLARLEGLVLRENDAMLDFSRRLGFVIAGVADDPTVVRVMLDLGDSVPGGEPAIDGEDDAAGVG